MSTLHPPGPPDNNGSPPPDPSDTPDDSTHGAPGTAAVDGPLAGDILGSLRCLYDRLAGQGKGPFRIKAELLKESDRLGHPLGPGEVDAALKEWTTPVVNGKACSPDSKGTKDGPPVCENVTDQPAEPPPAPEAQADPAVMARLATLSEIISYAAALRKRKISPDERFRLLSNRNEKLGSRLDEYGLYMHAFGTEEGHRRLREKRANNRGDKSANHTGQATSQVVKPSSDFLPGESSKESKGSLNASECLGKQGNVPRDREARHAGSDLSPKPKTQEQEDEEGMLADPHHLVFAAELETGHEPTQDLPTFLRCAIRHSIGRGDWEGQDAWYFMRLCQRHPKLRRLTEGKKAFACVDSHLMEILRREEHSSCPCPWEEYLGVDEDTAEATFCDRWAQVRLPPGCDPLDVALDRSRREPLDLRADVVERRPRLYPEFVALAGWLQFVRGADLIFLPRERVAELFGVSPSCITHYVRWAIADGYLQEREPARRDRAARYAFNVTRFKCLSEGCQDGTAELYQEQTD